MSKQDFAGINRVMRRAPVGGQNPLTRSIALDPIERGGAILDFDAVRVDDPKDTAATKLQKLHAQVADLTRYKGATEEEIGKIGLAVKDVLAKVDEESKKASEALALAQQLATTVPDRRGYDDDALKTIAFGFDRDEEMEKLAKSQPVSGGQRALTLLTDRELADRGASDDLRAQLREYRKLNDALLILNHHMASVNPAAYQSQSGMRGFKLWNRYEQLAKRFQLALGEGSATTGGNWVPTILSGNLWELIQVDMRLAEQFQRVQMPSLTYENPVEGADNVGYFIGEGVAITESDFDTQKATWTARKIAARTRTSYELDQDSVINISSEIMRKLAKALRRALERGIVNGQRSSTIDTGDAPGGTDVRSAWNGLRYAFSLTGLTPTDAGAGVTAEMLALLKGPMGANGLDPFDLFWLTGPWGYARLMTLKDQGGNAVVLTQDKAGGDATFKRGQLGSMFNSPLVVSEFVPENQNNAGIVDGSSDRTAIYLANREAFAIGERLGIVLDSSTHVHFSEDQVSFKAVARWDFQAARTPSANEIPVNAVGNLKTTGV